MIRKVIRIDEEKCTGCGACAAACHEGAIEMVNGKARLARENFCDGLGDCLPECPAGAISFEEREAAAYDAAAVLAAKTVRVTPRARKTDPTAPRPSRLAQWPCQIKLAPLAAPYFHSASLLIAADCTAYAYAAFHEDFMRSKVTLIGCPKLDGVDYSEKLTDILRLNGIRDVTVLRMEVPCCGGLESAVKRAIVRSGKPLPLRVVTVTTDGTAFES